MTGLALALLLVAAVGHATWNFVLKRVEQGGRGGPAFIWLLGVVSAVLYAPLMVYEALQQASRPAAPGVGSYWVVIVSGLIHLSYYLILQRGYQIGDLSLVYPLARGTGPLLATAGAIVLFGERPTATALAGAALVSASIVLLAGGLRRSGGSRRGLGVGLLIGVNIAAYTLWDSYGVGHVRVPPLLLDRGANIIVTLLLTPFAAARWDQVKSVWRTSRNAVLAVSVLSPLSYILVLQALTFTPASYIAPAREVSILFGTLMGMRWLKEGFTWKRLAGALGMVAALAALSIG